VLVDSGNSKDSVLSYIGMAVLKAGTRRGEERLDELGFSKLAQESQSVASNVFVGMLEIISDTVTLKYSVSVL
jgi:hypothetical protein